MTFADFLYFEAMYINRSRTLGTSTIRALVRAFCWKEMTENVTKSNICFAEERKVICVQDFWIKKSNASGRKAHILELSKTAQAICSQAFFLFIQRC